MINVDVLKENYSIKRFTIPKLFEIVKNEMVTFQIIPHADVTNNNRRMWRAIYKMFEMYDKPVSI